MPVSYKLTNLSRTISHALRHEPWLYELELDEEGWVDVEVLLAMLRNQRDEWTSLSVQDLVHLMAQAEKQRFELRGDRIRALYGHSTPQRLHKEPAVPPATLYHGTSAEAASCILREGLKPMGRQYVHLSTDRETARQVGLRKGREPVILEVQAAAAHAAGVVFYSGNDRIWLADFIPAAHIRYPSPVA